MLTRITDFIWDCIFSLAIWAMTDEERTKFNDITVSQPEEESNEQESEVRVEA